MLDDGTEMRRGVGRAIGLGTVLAVVLLAMASPAAAAEPEACTVGRAVVDGGGNAGVIAAADGTLCLVKYGNGQMQGWVPAARLQPAPAKDAAAAPSAGMAASGGDAVAILKPDIVNRQVYHADALGHVVLSAHVNDAPVRFMVDTGASLVCLTPKDAAAAGIADSTLAFTQTVQTGNGPVPAAVTELRAIRIGDLEIDNVQAAVIKSLKQSVLGMSFLKRVKSFEMGKGVLTLSW